MPDERTPLIEFQDVHKSFGSLNVLRGMDLRIYEGEITAIIGKSGVGKSVCLKHIIGLLAPDSGEILIEGRKLSAMSRDEYDAFRSRVSYMFQNNALFDSMTVFDNIALPLKEKTRMSREAIHEKVMERIDLLELSNVPQKYPSQLSGGMQRRVALARALINDPSIVLFDEPTTGQDPIRKNAILSMIAQYQQQFDFTAVMVSHDIPDVFYISNRVAILEKGEIIFQGFPAELERTEHPVIQEYVYSLDKLKDDLTGLETNNQFRKRYELLTGKTRQPFTVLVFYVEDLASLVGHVGHIAAQRIFQSLSHTLRAHLSESGIATRYGKEEVLTLLPFTSEQEARVLLEDIAAKLSRQESFRSKPYGDACFEFRLMVGLAQGKAGDTMDDMAARARDNMETLARLNCTSSENDTDMAASDTGAEATTG